MRSDIVKKDVGTQQGVAETGRQGLARIVIPNLLIFLTLAHVARASIFVRRRSGAEFASVDLHASVDILIVFVVFFVLFFAPRQRVWQKSSGTSASSLVWYYILCAVSFIWSALPMYTLFRAIQFISQFLAIFVAFSYYKDFYAAERRFLILSLLVTVLDLCTNLRLYGLGRFHTNSYSVSALVIFCYCLGELISGRQSGKRLLIPFAIVCLAFLAMGTSAASNVSAVVGLLVIGLLCRNILILVFCFLLAVLGILTLSPSDVMTILFPGKDMETVGGFTGRVLLWEYYYDAIRESPIWGHGFTMATRLAKLYATNAHNSVMAVLLGTGVLGFTIVLWGFIRLLREVIGNIRAGSPGAIGCASAFAAALVNSMSIAFVGDYWMAPSMTFTCLLAFHVFFVLPSRKGPRAGS